MAFICFAGAAGFDCSLIWIGIICLFFVGALFKKQVVENLLGGDFDVIIGTFTAEVLYIVSLYLMPMKYAFLVGIIGLLVGGFLAIRFTGEEM